MSTSTLPAPPTRHGSDSVADLWREYRSSRSRPARDQLVVHYMKSHVRPIAERLHSHLPKAVEVDDLVQEGYMGLVDAIDRYDADRDVKFETFSSRRVYGAMQDYLREIDPVPRVTRTRSKQYARMAEPFEARHGRSPDEDDLREHYNVDPDEARRLVKAAKPPAMVPFSTARPDGDDDDDGDAMHAFQGLHRTDPFTEAEREDIRGFLTKGFSRRDRLIVILYYFERMTMKEVGQVVGCCESRVSQRLEEIHRCLRARLGECREAERVLVHGDR